MPSPAFQPPLRTSAGRRLLGFVAVTLGVVQAHTLVHAQQADPALEMEMEEDAPIEMVVTASRVEEPARDAVVSTEVIGRKEIEQSGARNAAEVLEERAGLTIARSFNGSALWLRGLDPEYALILIDGDRVPGQVDGGLDLSRFGVEEIERIEIVRGPGSALYGADAIGGVVSILTREPVSDLDADAMFSYGQRNTLDLTGRVAGRPFDTLSVQLTGGYHRTDGFGDSLASTVSASAREQASGGLKLRYQPSERERAIGRVAYQRLSLVGTDGAPGGALIDRHQIQEQLSSSLEHRLRRHGGIELVSRGSYSQFRAQYLADQRGASVLDHYEDNREHLGQLTSLLELGAGSRYRTTLGLEHLFQVFDSERLKNRGNRYRLGVFGQLAWTAWKGAGGTSDTTPNELADLEHARFDVVPGVRLDIDSQFGPQLSPKLALRWAPSSRLELRASYGRGFRAPSFQELLIRFENPSVGYVVSGNADLDAETSHGVDAGIAYRPLDRVELATTFFRNDLRNMIAIVSSSGAGDSFGERFGYSNLARAYTMGLESSASLRLGRALSLQLGHTLLYTWDGEQEREIEGRPRHRLSASMRLLHPRWGTSLVARTAGQLGRVYFPVEDDGERRVVAPALWSLDVRASQKITRYAELSVGIDNLLDSRDEFALVIPFTLYASLRARY